MWDKKYFHKGLNTTLSNHTSKNVFLLIKAHSSTTCICLESSETAIATRFSSLQGSGLSPSSPDNPKCRRLAPEGSWTGSLSRFPLATWHWNRAAALPWRPCECGDYISLWWQNQHRKYAYFINSVLKHWYSSGTVDIPSQVENRTLMAMTQKQGHNVFYYPCAKKISALKTVVEINRVERL